MNNKSNIGKAFSERFKDFSIEPTPEVWENVSSRIPSSAPSPFLSKGFLYSAGAAVVIAVALFVFLNKNNDTQIKLSPKNIVNVNQNVVVTPSDDSNNIENDDYQNQKKVEPVIKPVLQNTKTDIKKSAKVDSNNLDNVVEVKTMRDPAVKLIDSRDIEIDSKGVVESIKGNPIMDSPMITTTDIPKIIPETLKRDSIKFSPDPIICFGEDAYLKVFGGLTYHWSNGDNLSKTTVHPVANSTYWVTVTDKYGNEQSHVFRVTIDKKCTSVFIPSAFTPNADGNNDIFKVFGENISDFHMQILNRQGQVLFNSYDINQGWDGMYNGELQPSQVYVYTIVYKNGRGEQNIKKGQFTLIR